MSADLIALVFIMCVHSHTHKKRGRRKKNRKRNVIDLQQHQQRMNEYMWCSDGMVWHVWDEYEYGLTFELYIYFVNFFSSRLLMKCISSDMER